MLSSCPLFSIFLLINGNLTGVKTLILNNHAISQGWRRLAIKAVPSFVCSPFPHFLFLLQPVLEHSLIVLLFATWSRRACHGCTLSLLPHDSASSSQSRLNMSLIHFLISLCFFYISVHSRSGPGIGHFSCCVLFMIPPSPVACNPLKMARWKTGGCGRRGGFWGEA